MFETVDEKEFVEYLKDQNIIKQRFGDYDRDIDIIKFDYCINIDDKILYSIKKGFVTRDGKCDYIDYIVYLRRKKILKLKECLKK